MLTRFRQFWPVTLFVLFLSTGVSLAQSTNVIPAFRAKSARTSVSTSVSHPTPAPVSMSSATIGKPTITNRSYFGFELGLNSTFFSSAKSYLIGFSATEGTTVIPGALKFDNLGSGLGFGVGGLLDFSLSNDIGIKAKVRYEELSASKTERHDEPCPDNMTSGTVPLESHYAATWDYAGIDAMLRVQLQQDGLYGTAGFGFYSLLSHSFEGYQKILGNCQYVDGNGDLTGVTEVTVPKQELPSYFNESRGLVKVGAGTYIPLTSDAILTPELTLAVPLTTFLTSSREDAYKTASIPTPSMYSVTLSVGIEFPFGSGSSSYASDLGDNTPADTHDLSDNSNAKYHLKGKVRDRKTGQPVDATMTAVDLNTNEVVSTGKTDNNGNYDLGVDHPGKYSVTADADNYLFGTVSFEVAEDGHIVQGNHDIPLEDASSGRTRLLVYFDYDKSTLQRSSYPELNRAARYIKANPAMEVEIAGYTDNKGTDAYNLDLSQRRANSVRDYLITKGVEANHVTAKGYGKASPVADNDTEDGRAQNRRVEFVVTKR